MSFVTLDSLVGPSSQLYYMADRSMEMSFQHVPNAIKRLTEVARSPIGDYPCECC